MWAWSTVEERNLNTNGIMIENEHMMGMCKRAGGGVEPKFERRDEPFMTQNLSDLIPTPFLTKLLLLCYEMSSAF
jgi:hypothetical protein